MFLYQENFEQQVYLQQGVTIQPGDTVVDVGSNVGLFAMAAASAAGPQGRVLCLEPIPETWQACASNLERHRAWCSEQGHQVAPCQVLNLGAGDGSCQEATFTVYTRASGWSSMYPDAAEALDNMNAFLERHVADPSTAAASHGGLGRRTLVWLARQLQLVPLLRPLFRHLTSTYTRLVLLSGSDRVVCRLAPLSQLLQQQGIREVGLLKVDVERAELDVLRGVEPHDWQRVRQVALEVHDIGGRLSQVRQLLEESAGFDRVVAVQEVQLTGSNLYTVFATRITCSPAAHQQTQTRARMRLV